MERIIHSYNKMQSGRTVILLLLNDLPERKIGMERKIIKAGICTIVASCVFTFAAPFVCNMMGIQEQTCAYAANIKISKQSASIKVGNTSTLCLKGIAAKQSKSIKWSSTNTKIVKVKKSKTKKGAYVCSITGVNAGKCTVKAVYKKKIYKCKVTVEKTESVTPTPDVPATPDIPDTPVVISPVEKVMQAVENSATSYKNEAGDSVVANSESDGSKYAVIADRTNSCVKFAAIINLSTSSFSCTLCCTDEDVAKATIVSISQSGKTTSATADVDKSKATKLSHWEWKDATAVEKYINDMALQLALMRWSTTLETNTGCHMSELGFASL